MILLTPIISRNLTFFATFIQNQIMFLLPHNVWLVYPFTSQSSHMTNTVLFGIHQLLHLVTICTNRQKMQNLYYSTSVSAYPDMANMEKVKFFYCLFFFISWSTMEHNIGIISFILLYAYNLVMYAYWIHSCESFTSCSIVLQLTKITIIKRTLHPHLSHNGRIYQFYCVLVTNRLYSLFITFLTYPATERFATLVSFFCTNIP